MSLRFTFFIGAYLLSSLLVATAQADVTPEQRRESRRIQQQISAAQRFLQSDRTEDAYERVQEIQESLEKLVAANDEDVNQLIEGHLRRMQELHGRLELEGYELKPLLMPGSEEAMSAGGVSFVSEVAPILMAKCGRCHVNRMSGGLSLANYDTIMVGPSEGKIVFGGDADGSRLIEVIVEGDMPRGGGSVSDEELDTLKNWIVSGARFDGEDRAASLASLVPEDSAPTMPAASLVVSTGNETVSFSADVAPLLVENCSGCHINAQRVRGGLNMDNMQRLLRGGDGGSMIVQGKPEESLLIGKLKGTAGGQRMPVNRPALSDEAIATIAKWIEEGATYDAGDPNTAIGTVAAIALANKSSHEELAQQRVGLAQGNWNLAMPSVSFNLYESENYTVLGNTDEETLEEVAQRAESVEETVSRLFRAPSRSRLIKGRLSLFVFGQRYDYSEFGQMVEQRQLPDEWKGHWRFTVVDAYGAMILPRSDEEYSLEGLLAQQIAGVHVASLGTTVPNWFAEGAARVAALRVEREDPRVIRWQERLPEALSHFDKPSDFLTGRAGPEDTALASFSFVEFLMSDSRRFTRLLGGLRDGNKFEEVFASVYGGTPAQVSQAWARSGLGR